MPRQAGVFAYKEDRYTFDDICLGLRVNEEGAWYMVSGDFAEYRPFLRHLEQRLPGFRKDWLSEVAVPASREPDALGRAPVDYEGVRRRRVGWSFSLERFLSLREWRLPWRRPPAR